MERFFNKIGKIGGALCIGGVFCSFFVFSVDGGERVVKFDKIRGVQPTVYGEGMHFIIPFIQVILKFLILVASQEVRSESKTPNDPLNNRNQRPLDCRPLFENLIQAS
jgi:regulator of protease activity HflC (stomatin/prohibitin superfamily)